MAVLARTDPHATYDDVRTAHPDWIAVDSEGRQRQHWASPEMWITCSLGPYNFEFMTAVHNEVMTRYSVDGIFINRWSGSGMCYCEHCRTNFRADRARAPETGQPTRRGPRSRILWSQRRFYDLWRLWDAEVRKINPDSCVIPNASSSATSPLDMKAIGELAPTLFADRQARSGLMPPWANGEAAKEYRAAMGRKPIGGIFSMGVEEAYRWKDSVQSEAEVRIWFADGVANGLHLRLPSSRARSPRPPLARGRRKPLPLAPPGRTLPAERGAAGPGRPGLLAADRLVLRQPRARQKVEDHALGWYQALIEGRIPFSEMVHDRLLDAGNLDRIRTLILPNITALSNGQCRQLRRVRRPGRRYGGDVRNVDLRRVGTAKNRLRAGGCLRCVVSRPRRANAKRLSAPRGRPRHGPAASDTGWPGRRARIIHGTYRLDVAPNREFPRSPLTLIPSYPDLPMEKVYPHRQADVAELYLRHAGPGRVVYFPWDIDRIFWEVLAVDHGTCSGTPCSGRRTRSRRYRSPAPACST